MKLFFLGCCLGLPLWAAAQGLGLPALPPPTRLPSALEPLDRLGRNPPLPLLRDSLPDLGVRAELLSERLRRDPGTWMPDRQGHPVLRRRLLWLSPTAAQRLRSEAEGWRWLAPLPLPNLALTAWQVEPPPGLDAVQALAQHRSGASSLADPPNPPGAGDRSDGDLELEPLYLPAGTVSSPAEAAVSGLALPADPASASAPRLGLLDTGVDMRHPALAALSLRVLGCAPRAHGHGTAVASLLVGRAEGLRSAAPGQSLAAVDVDCGEPGGGSVSRLVLGLEALVQAGVRVINISLVGPPNRLLAAAVAAAQARGVLIVAAAGNDGPAAAPLYPAAYPGVLGVAATDARRRPLPESARGDAVSASAVGAELPVARLGGGLALARGSSFAAPWLAGRLAQAWGEAPASPQRAETLRQALRAQLEDLGEPGRDAVYGWGWAGPRWSLKVQ